MKKLLSIFTVGIFLGPGVISSGAGIACRSSSKKLNINSLADYGLKYSVRAYNLISDINKDNEIIIDVPLAYEFLEAQIIKEYDLFFNYKQKLAMTDFVHGLKPTTKHPWAIQIYDIDDKSWILDEPQNWALNFNTPKYNVLKDNGLKVEINTLDKNVKSPQGTFRYCFNKFWYTNKNANKGHDVSVNTTKSATQNHLSSANVIDLTKDLDNPVHFKLSAKNLRIQGNVAIRMLWDNLAPNYKQEIASRFVTNLNLQLKTKTQKLNTLNKVKIANNNVDKNNAQDFFNGSANFYSVNDKTDPPQYIDYGWDPVVGGECLCST